MAEREMTNEEAIEILSGIRACYNIFDEYDEPKYAALSKAIFALKAEKTEPYIEFCEWVADTVLYEDFEDKWTLGAFAEVACRKLHKIGLVRKDGEYWTMDEVKNGTK